MSIHDDYIDGNYGTKDDPWNLSFLTLREANINRCERGFGHTLESWSVAEWGNATAGELGEACNIAKKLLRFRDNIKGNDQNKTIENYKNELAREMADTLIYLDLWAASQGINLSEAVKNAFNNKSKEIGSNISCLSG